jgi:8-oxo-dGTP pyrophosphatase MutT (NUDIX family)
VDFDPYPDPSAVSIGKLRVAVSALVWNDEGHILLQRRSDNGHWGMPGGGIEPGESITQAVIREVWEETGYTVEPTRLIGVYSDPANHQIIQYPNGDVVHYVTVAFEAKVTGGSPTLSDETLAIEWHHPDKVPEPFVPPHRIRLRDALARREAAFIR